MGVGHVLPLVPKDPSEEVKTRPGVKGRSQSLASCILHRYPFCGREHTCPPPGGILPSHVILPYSSGVTDGALEEAGTPRLESS